MVLTMLFTMTPMLSSSSVNRVPCDARPITYLQLPQNGPNAHTRRMRHTASQLCRSAANETASTSDYDDNERLNKLVALIQTAELLAPFDPNDFNTALLLWTQIAAIPPAMRTRLLDRLGPACALLPLCYKMMQMTCLLAGTSSAYGD